MKRLIGINKIVCVWCGGEFLQSASYNRFCSLYCRERHKEHSTTYWHTMFCVQCGTPFRPSQHTGIKYYCSVKCQYVAANARRRLRDNERKKVECKICNKLIFNIGGALYCKECRQLNIKRIKERWLDRHPGRRQNSVRKYNNSNKGKAVQHRRRARKLKNGGSFTSAELKSQFIKQEGKCYYCGDLLFSRFDKYYHVEHKTPLCRGGTNNISNIVLSCAECNHRKHTKTEAEFLGATTL